MKVINECKKLEHSGKKSPKNEYNEAPSVRFDCILLILVVDLNYPEKNTNLKPVINAQ